jgi:hypothetical protein
MSNFALCQYALNSARFVVVDGHPRRHSIGQLSADILTWRMTASSEAVATYRREKAPISLTKAYFEALIMVRQRVAQADDFGLSLACGRRDTFASE